MIRRIAIAAALALCACSPPSAQAPEKTAAAGPSEAAAQTSSAEAPAGAEAAITAWFRQGEALLEPVEVFYGDFSGDGAADALAWGYYDMGTSAGVTSAGGMTIALFRNEGGRMTFVRTVDEVQGTEPTNVSIRTGRTMLTTKVPLPTDPGCCPTGSQEWTIATD